MELYPQLGMHLPKDVMYEQWQNCSPLSLSLDKLSSRARDYPLHARSMRIGYDIHESTAEVCDNCVARPAIDQLNRRCECETAKLVTNRYGNFLQGPSV